MSSLACRSVSNKQVPTATKLYHLIESGEIMPRYFADNSTHATRAQQIWPILIAAAVERKIVTYGMIAHLIGYKVSVALGEPLFHIKHWCEVNGLPPLTVIVVNKETGKPGSGISLIDVDIAREAVFNYAWYSLVPPTVEELKEAYKAEHQQA